MPSNDDTPAPTRVKFDFAFDITHLKPGEHTFLLTIGDEESKLIGQIVSYWGVFELRMDATIEHIASIMSYETPEGWKRLAFRRRKELFKEIMRVYTSIMFPAMRSEFDKIADRAGDLHWRRNIVAHGHYEPLPGAIIEGGASYKAKFVATGNISGKMRSIPIETEPLSKLWHDISHLIGALLFLISQMGGKSNAIDLVIPDNEILRDQKSGSFHFLPISDKF